MPSRSSVTPRKVPSRRQKRVKNTRQTTTRSSSTYGNNNLRTPSISRPGASLGQGKGRGTIARVNTRTKHKTTTTRSVRHTNYRISNRNPMND